MKKVSIIIPVYNEEYFILDTINSVLNQTYKNFEILVVDNGSNDNSIEFVKNIQDDRIKIITIKDNQGVAFARNIGIEESRGDYICFLDADDYWTKKKLEKQVKFMEENNYEFIYSDYMFVDRNGFEKKYVKVPLFLNYKKALKNTTIFTSTVMLNVNKLKKETIYMPNIERGQDTATWWQILKTGVNAYGMNELFAYYRLKGNSLSSNKLLALKRTWNIYKLQNICLIKRLYYFNFYMINAVRRRLL